MQCNIYRPYCLWADKGRASGLVVQNDFADNGPHAAGQLSQVHHSFDGHFSAATWWPIVLRGDGERERVQGQSMAIYHTRCHTRKVRRCQLNSTCNVTQ